MSENKRKNRFKLSPEKTAAVKKRLLETRASWTLAYQLGHYVGAQIVDKYLPTLSVDSMHTRNVLPVSPEEEIECKRLDNIWFGKRLSINNLTEEEQTKATETEWNALRAYHEMLEEKYLPKTIECHFGVLNITPENMKEFKEGVGTALWDCDCSHYSTKPEDITVQADEDGWFTNITIKRS